MERPIEVVALDRGKLQSVRTMSRARERAAAIVGAGIGAAVVLAAMLATMGLVTLAGLVVHAAVFFACWSVVAAAVAFACGRRAAERWRRYRLGPHVEADAFAMIDVELVRRGDHGYELSVVPGMSGAVEGGRADLPLEVFARPGGGRLPLPPAGRVRVELGAATFIITRTDEPPPASSYREGARALVGGATRRFARLAAAAIPFAALPSLLGAVPDALAVDMAGPFAIPRGAPAVMVEKLIRAKAQTQTSRLHECFDPMPLACQRDGYVAVGLSLSKDGEVLSHWVSRSTYREDCPVTECMAKTAASWVYEPMWEPMKLVLPIQVRRTRKPLPAQPQVTFASPPDALDAEAWRPVLLAAPPGEPPARPQARDLTFASPEE